jgi:hypothetical protein
VSIDWRESRIQLDKLDQSMKLERNKALNLSFRVRS